MEFPKIIYGNPTYYGDAGQSYQAISADWDLIDEAGFNMILSDYILIPVIIIGDFACHLFGDGDQI